MIQLASQDYCTGCSACAYVCTKKAISMIPNNIGIILPQINNNLCINCGLCQKICPILAPPQLYKPIKAYAAWHNDTHERVKSASGAIAAAAYKFALSSGMNIVGAIQNEDFSVDVIISDKIDDIELFRNSKYVFSSIKNLLPSLKRSIKDRKRVLIIALPCQIAAIRKCFPKQDLFIYADIVCHGSTPTEYLQQHIRKIELETGKKAKNMFFRDPYSYTHTYTFSLYDNSGKRFYAKRTINGDTYQIGYHRIISYRNNCFNCLFAKPERVGDFTLCDYSGLGKITSFEYNHINTSCILINNKNGELFLKPLIENNIITAIERPIIEPIKGNRQLQKPCKKSIARKDFEKQIIRYNGDFEKAMNIVIHNMYTRKKFLFWIDLPIRLKNKLINLASKYKKI